MSEATTPEKDSGGMAVIGADEHRSSEQPARELSQEEIFDVLSSQRRRFILHYLLQNEGGGSLKHVVTTVAAWENDTSPEELSSKLRTRAYTTIRQTHLPKMDEYGVVEYDPDSGDINLTPSGEILKQYLDEPPGSEENWWLYYLGVGIIGAILGVIASGPFLPPLTGDSAALLTAGAVSGLALVQFVRTNSRQRFSGEIPERR